MPVQVKDVDASTEDAFLRCLHLEKPADPVMMQLRRRWYDRYKGEGLRGKVLVDEANTVLAMGQYVPIEVSPFLGEGLAAILCMWVHGYQHHIGNVQGRGHGRQLLKAMEEEIAAAGFKGVAAWGMDFPFWNPVSWYLSRGYEKVDQRGLEVLVWKPLAQDATPPRFIEKTCDIPVDPDKPTITVYLNGWCTGGCHNVAKCRAAAEALGEEARLIEFDTDAKADMLKHHMDYGLYVNGEPYREFEEPWPVDQLVADVRSAARKSSDAAD